VVTVNELRSIVRTQTQTDPADLPDATIDVFLQQAFERTLNAEVEWPFYAKTWQVTQLANEPWITLPGDVSIPGIRALADADSGVRLSMVPQVWAEDRFPGNSTGSIGPAMFSPWGSQLSLWPALTYDADHDYTLRGYRRPLNWIADDQPDCDPRLHLPLSHYAVALAYAQQEDEVLEATYMARWQTDVELAHQNIMSPVHHRPLVMAGAVIRYPHDPTFLGFVVETPAGP
jgi:hypothetical protein